MKRRYERPAMEIFPIEVPQLLDASQQGYGDPNTGEWKDP